MFISHRKKRKIPDVIHVTERTLNMCSEKQECNLYWRSECPDIVLTLSVVMTCTGLVLLAHCCSE